jgi:hypothetical protein
MKRFDAIHRGIKSCKIVCDAEHRGVKSYHVVRDAEHRGVKSYHVVRDATHCGVKSYDAGDLPASCGRGKYNAGRLPASCGREKVAVSSSSKQWQPAHCLLPTATAYCRLLLLTATASASPRLCVKKQLNNSTTKQFNHVLQS